MMPELKKKPTCVVAEELLNKKCPLLETLPNKRLSIVCERVTKFYDFEEGNETLTNP